eukprot:m.15807 g.15807  ORF g.15807 m.15807 type:complete len:533 (-) comp3317_c0_seq1:60-1658(-)
MSVTSKRFALRTTVNVQFLRFDCSTSGSVLSAATRLIRGSGKWQVDVCTMGKPGGDAEDDVESYRTVHVEGLSEYTREEQIAALFSLSGYIEAIHMGIWKDTRTPAGFCFIEFSDAEAADACTLYQSGARLDDEVLDVRIDTKGFVQGRQIRTRRGADDSHAVAPLGAPRGRRLLPKSVNLLEMRMKPRGVAALDNDDGTVVLERVNGDTIRVLSQEEAAVFRENPHLQQAFINEGGLDYADLPLGVENLVIPRDWLPSSAYQRRRNTVKTLPENKTRGRALSLIWFLTKHSGGANTVVYACDSGNGLTDLITETFFPNLDFDVYGEASTEVTGSDRVKTHAARFTDADADKYKDKDGILFVCSYPSSAQEKATANNLWKDMRDQRQWTEAMRPMAAMLQWRLPFTPPAGESEYFDGEIFLLPWNRTSLNTCVLIVTDVDAKRVYDHADYEGYMFHHNRYTRQKYFELPYETDALLPIGLDHGWDSAAELLVLHNYVRELAQQPSSTEDRAKALELSALLSGISPNGEARAD